MVDPHLTNLQSQKMIKLVAFDWNGTILADMQAVHKADNKVLKSMGAKPVDLKTLQEKYDVPIVKYFISVGVKEETIIENTKLNRKVFYENYEKEAKNARTRSHAKTVLEWMETRGINRIVFSNNTLESIQGHAKRLRISGYFKEILAASLPGLALSSRTKNVLLKEYVQKNGLKPDELLIVGDTIEEIQIAKSLGSMVCSITHGNCSTRRLKAAKPDYLISDLGQMINIVRKINS